MGAERVRRFLDERGVAYDADVHDRAVDAQHLAEAEQVSGWLVAKPVLLEVDGRLVMVVIPGPAQVDVDRVREQLDADEVRLAREGEFVDRFPDCEPGAEPPFGQLYDVEMYIDPILRQDEALVFRAGTHDTAMRVRTEDYLAAVSADELAVAVMPS